MLRLFRGGFRGHGCLMLFSVIERWRGCGRLGEDLS